MVIQNYVKYDFHLNMVIVYKSFGKSKNRENFNNGQFSEFQKLSNNGKQKIFNFNNSNFRTFFKVEH